MSQDAGPEQRQDEQQQRLIELLMAISLATDLGTGQPMGHALRTSYISAALARELGCSDEETRTVLQVALLRFLGCTSDASESAEMAGGNEIHLNATMAMPLMGTNQEMLGGLIQAVGAGQPRLRRAGMIAKAMADPGGLARSLATHCEVATMLAHRLGLGQDVITSLGHAYERWDGKGHPAKLRREAIPLPVRIAIVARDADLIVRRGENPSFRLASRSGHAYDPTVVHTFMRNGMDYIAAYDRADGWHAVLDCEPQPGTMISGSQMDTALTAIADFVDLKSPWTRGHSPAVADLAQGAAASIGLKLEEQLALRRAGLVHDIGRVGIENGIWDKPGPLTIEEWERVRMHPYFTQRILDRCGALSGLSQIASSDHERVDGSGYHRGLEAAQLPILARILAAADVLAALCAERPHRQAMTHTEAAELLEQEVEAGQLDATAVAGVLDAAGVRPAEPLPAWPGGLTDREVEVLRQITKGRTNRQVADRLSISPKTVGRHIENIYSKIGVSTRAGAAVFAMEHRLLG